MRFGRWSRDDIGEGFCWEEPGRKSPFRSHSLRWKDNIKKHVMYGGIVLTEFIWLRVGTNKWWTVVSTAVNLVFFKNKMLRMWPLWLSRDGPCCVSLIRWLRNCLTELYPVPKTYFFKHQVPWSCCSHRMHLLSFLIRFPSKNYVRNSRFHYACCVLIGLRISGVCCSRSWESVITAVLRDNRGIISLYLVHICS